MTYYSFYPATPNLLHFAASTSIRNVHGGSTYNDLPQPKGDWKALDAKRQSGHNMNLIIGLVSFAAAIAVGFVGGFFDDHYDLPEKPMKIKNFKTGELEDEDEEGKKEGEE